MKNIKRYDEALAKMDEAHEYIPELVDVEELFTAYCRSCDRGLELIDLDGPIWDDKIGAISGAMKVHDVTKFTISSTYPGMVNTIAQFCDRGWEIAGIAKINSGYTEWTPEGEKPRLTNAFVLAR